MAKLHWSETNQRLTSFAQNLLGLTAQLDDEGAVWDGFWTYSSCAAAATRSRRGPPRSSATSSPSGSSACRSLDRGARRGLRILRGPGAAARRPRGSTWPTACPTTGWSPSPSPTRAPTRRTGRRSPTWAGSTPSSGCSSTPYWPRRPATRCYPTPWWSTVALAWPLLDDELRGAVGAGERSATLAWAEPGGPRRSPLPPAGSTVNRRRTAASPAPRSRSRT